MNNVEFLFWKIWHNHYIRQHILAQKRPLSVRYSANCAAKFGLLESFLYEVLDHRYIDAYGFPMDLAAECGHLKVVQWLHANRREGCTTNAINLAAARGHLKVVKWLHENRTEGCTTDAMDFAAAHGHLKVVQWLHANRQEGCTTDAIIWAARNNQLEVLQWLHANRIKRLHY